MQLYKLSTISNSNWTIQSHNNLLCPKKLVWVWFDQISVCRSSFVANMRRGTKRACKSILVMTKMMIQWVPYPVNLLVVVFVLLWCYCCCDVCVGCDVIVVVICPAVAWDSTVWRLSNIWVYIWSYLPLPWSVEHDHLMCSQSDGNAVVGSYIWFYF